MFSKDAENHLTQLRALGAGPEGVAGMPWNLLFNKGLMGGEKKEKENHPIQWFSRCFSGLTGSVSPENLLEMKIIKSHFRPTKLETLGEGPSNLCFNKLSR